MGFWKYAAAVGGTIFAGVLLYSSYLIGNKKAEETKKQEKPAHVRILEETDEKLENGLATLRDTLKDRLDRLEKEDKKEPSEFEKFARKFGEKYSDMEKLIAAYENMKKSDADKYVDVAPSTHIFVDDDLLEVNSLDIAKLRLYDRDGELHIFTFYSGEVQQSGSGRKYASAREVGRLALAQVKENLDKEGREYYATAVVPELLKMGAYTDYVAMRGGEKEGKDRNLTRGPKDITAFKIWKYENNYVEKDYEKKEAEETDEFKRDLEDFKKDLEREMDGIHRHIEDYKRKEGKGYEQLWKQLHNFERDLKRELNGINRQIEDYKRKEGKGYEGLGKQLEDFEKKLDDLNKKIEEANKKKFLEEKKLPEESFHYR